MLRQFFATETRTRIDDQIDLVLDEMSAIGVNSQEYHEKLTYLERLHKLKTAGKQPREVVSPNTVLTVIGSLFGTIILVGYEQKHVITSVRGFQSLLRPKTP